MSSSLSHLIASPSGRPSTSNPKLRSMTPAATSPEAVVQHPYTAHDATSLAINTTDHHHHHNNDTSTGGGAPPNFDGSRTLAGPPASTASGGMPSPAPAVPPKRPIDADHSAEAALARLKALDPMVLWSTESDVPVSMLARPHTSNPRYVDGLMTSGRGPSAEMPSSAHHSQPTVFVDTAAGVSPVNPSTPIVVDRERGQSISTNSAPVLWSDGTCGTVDPQLLARPVSANPWLQRVFDSVEKLIPMEEPLLSELEQVRGTTPLSGLANANPFSVTSPSAANNKSNSTPQILWAAPNNVADWRLLARPHSSNPILERSRQSKEAVIGGDDEDEVGTQGSTPSAGGGTISSSRRRKSEPQGSYILWSREEQQAGPSSSHVDASGDGGGAAGAINMTVVLESLAKDALITSLQQIIDRQQAQLLAMGQRVTSLEAALAHHKIVPPPYNPSPSTAADGSRRPSAGVAVSSSPPFVRPTSSRGASSGNNAMTQQHRPRTAIPNDPSIRLESTDITRPSRDRDPSPPQQYNTGGGEGAVTEAPQVLSIDPERDYPNAEAVSTPTDRSVPPAGVMLCTSPLPPQSPISFGAGEASPSPVSIRRHSGNTNDGDDEDDAIIPKNSNKAAHVNYSKSPAATHIGRPKTAIGARGGSTNSRSSPPNNTTTNAAANEAPARNSQQLPIPRLADDDDEDAEYEVFDDAQEALINDRGLPQRAPTVKEAMAYDVDPPHPNIPTPTDLERPNASATGSPVTLSQRGEPSSPSDHASASALPTTYYGGPNGGGPRPISAAPSSASASARVERDRPRSAGKVIVPAPPNVMADIREARPSSLADSDIYIREDRGELSNEEEVERSFQKGYRRSPSAQNNQHMATGHGNTMLARSVQYGRVPTTHGGAYNTGMGMPPRPESALPSRRAARLRMVVGQCRPTTAPNGRSASAAAGNGDGGSAPLRPSTAAHARSTAVEDGPTASSSANAYALAPTFTPYDASGRAVGRRCASASLSRPFLDTTNKHLGSTDTRLYGKQRDQDIRKEYANILRRGEHAVTKDDFKALYMERAGDFGMCPSDNDVEDLMAPFHKEGVDYLSLEEFGILFLKMSAW